MLWPSLYISAQHFNPHLYIMMRRVVALIKYSASALDGEEGEKVPADSKHCQLMIYVYKWILKYIRELIRHLASCLASNHLWAAEKRRPRLLLAWWSRVTMGKEERVKRYRGSLLHLDLEGPDCFWLGEMKGNLWGKLAPRPAWR